MVATIPQRACPSLVGYHRNDLGFPIHSPQLGGYSGVPMSCPWRGFSVAHLGGEVVADDWGYLRTGCLVTPLGRWATIESGTTTVLKRVRKKYVATEISPNHFWERGKGLTDGTSS